MASKHARKKSKSKDSDLIPIIYQVPGGIEIVSGYLEKKSLPDGVKSMRFFGFVKCGSSESGLIIQLLSC